MGRAEQISVINITLLQSHRGSEASPTLSDDGGRAPSSSRAPGSPSVSQASFGKPKSSKGLLSIYSNQYTIIIIGIISPTIV